MPTPWEIAMDIPSAHGLAADTFAHLCGGPGGYCLSTPDFFLLVREVALPEAVREYISLYRIMVGGGWQQICQDDIAHVRAMTDPFHRFPHGECNAWCIGVLAGDMVAAYRALVAVGGEREYLCWQDRANGYRWRKTGPAFDKFLATIHEQRQSRQLRSGQNAERIIGGVEDTKPGDFGANAATGGSGQDPQAPKDRPSHAAA